MIQKTGQKRVGIQQDLFSILKDNNMLSIY